MWGGVTLAYRKRMQDSPAYRLNHEEVTKALEEGITFAETLDPVEAVPDSAWALSEGSNLHHLGFWSDDVPLVEPPEVEPLEVEPLEEGAAAAPPIAPVPRTGPLPLSFAQQRLWVLDRMELVTLDYRPRTKFDPKPWVWGPGDGLRYSAFELTVEPHRATPGELAELRHEVEDTDEFVRRFLPCAGSGQRGLAGVA